MLAVYTIIQASHYAWGSAHTLGLGTLAVVLMLGFLTRQARAATPLMPVRIVRSRTASVANLVQAMMLAGLFGMFFLGALYLQGVLHYGPIEVGLAFLPVALAIAVLALGFTARLIIRVGAIRTLTGGLILIAAGLLIYRRVPVHAHYVRDLLPALVLMGVGAGLAFPSLMTVAMSAATPEDSGLASGLVNTSQQVGGALGLAVLATIATNHTHALHTHGAPLATSLTGGYHLAWTIAAALVLIAIPVAGLLLQQPAAPEQQHGTVPLDHDHAYHEQAA
jgi:hypothetical protein